MRANEYQVATRRTRPPLVQGNYELELRQSVLGIASEAGEVAGVIEKHLFQGHPLDKDKLIKEMGDVLWYLAMMSDAMKVSLEDVMERNIEKLKARYPEKFTVEDSIKRTDADYG